MSGQSGGARRAAPAPLAFSERQPFEAPLPKANAPSAFEKHWRTQKLSARWTRAGPAQRAVPHLMKILPGNPIVPMLLPVSIRITLLSETLA
jgi:hypothetical protein